MAVIVFPTPATAPGLRQAVEAFLDGAPVATTRAA